MLSVTALTTAKLVGTGFCFGIGFWAAKKLTNVLDEKLALYDHKEIERLAKEMNLQPL